MLDDLLAGRPGGIRPSLIAAVTGLTETEVLEMLDQLLLDGELVPHYSMACQSGDDRCMGGTLTGWWDIQDIPYGERVTCSTCGHGTRVTDITVRTVFLRP